MRSAETFIAAGIKWDFLVFKHNEHQPHKLAQDMGFKEFFVRKTGRFLSAGELRASEHARSEAGSSTGWSNPPVAFIPAFGNLEQVKQRYGEYQTYLDQVEVNCKVAGGKGKMYLSAQDAPYLLLARGRI